MGNDVTQAALEAAANATNAGAAAAMSSKSAGADSDWVALAGS